MTYQKKGWPTWDHSGRRMLSQAYMDRAADLLPRIEEYLKRTGMTPSRFGRLMGDPRFVFDKRKGAGVSKSVMRRAEEIMRTHDGFVGKTQSHFYTSRNPSNIRRWKGRDGTALLEEVLRIRNAEKLSRAEMRRIRLRSIRRKKNARSSQT